MDFYEFCSVDLSDSVLVKRAIFFRINRNCVIFLGICSGIYTVFINKVDEEESHCYTQKKETEAHFLEALPDIKIEYDDWDDLRRKLGKVSI